MQYYLKENNLHISLIWLCLMTLFLPPLALPVFGSSFTVYIGEIFGLILLLVVLLKMLSNGSFVLNTVTKASIAFLVVGSMSIIHADDLGRFFIGAKVYLTVSLILLVFSNITLGERKQGLMINTFIYSALVLAIWIIAVTFFQNGGQFLIGNKITLSIGASNYLASILMIPYFISLTILTKYSNSKSLAKYLISLVLCAVAIIFTGSRTAIMILFGFTMLFFLIDSFSLKQSISKKVINIFLIVGAFIGIYKLGGDFFSQMVDQGRFTLEGLSGNASGRVDIYIEYLQAFSDHIILGNGFNNVNALNQYYMAHNFILQILGDTGIAGFSMFCTFIVTIFVYLSRKLKEIQTSAGYHDLLECFLLGYRRCFIVVFVHGMVEVNYGTGLFMIYLFIGLGILMASRNTVGANAVNK